ANGRLTPEDVRQREAVIAAADVLLLQLEVPPETVEAAAQVARRRGVRVVLDPAPAPRGALLETLRGVDLITPNQTEIEALTGVPVTGPDAARRAAAILLQGGAGAVVVKLGAMGALVCDVQGHETLVPTARVNVVDTTAAGDAFSAALAIGLAEGRPLHAA